MHGWLGRNDAWQCQHACSDSVCVRNEKDKGCRSKLLAQCLLKVEPLVNSHDGDAALTLLSWDCPAGLRQALLHRELQRLLQRDQGGAPAHAPDRQLPYGLG